MEQNDEDYKQNACSIKWRMQEVYTKMIGLTLKRGYDRSTLKTSKGNTISYLIDVNIIYTVVRVCVHKTFAPTTALLL